MTTTQAHRLGRVLAHSAFCICGEEFADRAAVAAHKVLANATGERREVTIDKAIEALYIAAVRAQGPVEAAARGIMWAAGARQINRAGTRWSMSFSEALSIARRGAATEQVSLNTPAAVALERYEEAKAAMVTAREAFEAAEKQYTGWSRFFMVPGGHIHSSRNCSTCNNGETPTQFGWLPTLSGLTEEAAVKDQGPLLCTTCFPSAPVEWTNGREAGKADECPGSRKAAHSDLPHRVGYSYGNWATCHECGGRPAITSRGLLKAHKPGYNKREES